MRVDVCVGACAEDSAGKVELKPKRRAARVDERTCGRERECGYGWDDAWNSKKSSASERRSAGIGLSGVGSRRGCHCHCQDHGDENLNLMRSLDGRRTSARFPQPTCHVSKYRTAMAMRRRADVRELPNHDSDKKTEDVPCLGIGRRSCQPPVSGSAGRGWAPSISIFASHRHDTAGRDGFRASPLAAVRAMKR